MCDVLGPRHKELLPVSGGDGKSLLALAGMWDRDRRCSLQRSDFVLKILRPKHLTFVPHHCQLGCAVVVVTGKPQALNSHSTCSITSALVRRFSFSFVLSSATRVVARACACPWTALCFRSFCCAIWSIIQHFLHLPGRRWKSGHPSCRQDGASRRNRSYRRKCYPPHVCCG
jgi:hypothetical protein